MRSVRARALHAACVWWWWAGRRPGMRAAPAAGQARTARTARASAGAARHPGGEPLVWRLDLHLRWRRHLLDAFLRGGRCRSTRSSSRRSGAPGEGWELGSIWDGLGASAIGIGRWDQRFSELYHSRVSVSVGLRVGLRLEGSPQIPIPNATRRTCGVRSETRTRQNPNPNPNPDPEP